MQPKTQCIKPEINHDELNIFRSCIAHVASMEQCNPGITS